MLTLLVFIESLAYDGNRITDSLVCTATKTEETNSFHVKDQCLANRVFTFCDRPRR